MIVRGNRSRSCCAGAWELAPTPVEMSADVAISTALSSQRAGAGHRPPHAGRLSSLILQLLVSYPCAENRLAQVLLYNSPQEAAPDNDEAQSSSIGADSPRGYAAADFAGSVYTFRRRRVMAAVKYRTVEVDGLQIFYREAGAAAAPHLLLLHGFPSASHMFRDLIPLLADRFHVIAPDLPGFGQSGIPPRRAFSYTFDNLAGVIDRFTQVVGLDRFAVYVFDYGAPIGFRLAMRHPERITGIVSQ